MARSFVFVAVLAAFATIGCKHSPSCKDAVQQAVGKVRSESAYAAQLIGWCEVQGWSSEVRGCLANAKSDTELNACTQLDKKAKAAEEARTKTEAAAAEAAKAAQTAQSAVDDLTKQLADLDKQIAKADAETTAAAGSASGSGGSGASAKPDPKAKKPDKPKPN